MRWITVILALTVPACGQFSDLATTVHGSRVYFTSTYRLRGSSEYLASKIFMIDEAGAHLIDDEGGPGGKDYVLPYYDLLLPRVSGDGSLLLYTARVACGSGAACAYDERSSPRTTPGTPNPLAGEQGGVLISRNGRFAALFATTADAVLGFTATVVDFESGNRSQTSINSLFAVASDGSILANAAKAGSRGLYLIGLQGQATLICPGDIDGATMSDDASVIVCEPRSHGLLVSDRNGNSSPLTAAGPAATQPLLTSDGCSLIFIAPVDGVKQLFVIAADGSQMRQLTVGSDAVVEATLSGDGQVAYASTSSGCLLRIATAASEIVQLVGPSPNHLTFTGGHAPGSSIVIDGANLDIVDGGTLLVAETPAPLLSVSSERLIFQIPWAAPDETSPGDDMPATSIPIRKTALVMPGAGPYFEAAFWFPVYAFDPVAVTLGPFDVRGYIPIALHGDDTGLVTADSPAHFGEIVTIYATGLGPVSPPLSDGAPAPTDSYSLVDPPLEFSFSSGGIQIPATAQFAGLAPGYVGLYQINVQVPVNLPIPDGLSGPFFLSLVCASSSLQTTTSFVACLGAVPVGI